MTAIVHLDADAFFASVEQAADSRLRGRPVAVGGEKRGIIASASYEARKFGVYTPMPTALARRLCPKLTVLPGDFEKYERFSNWMFSYAYDFTPDVEIGSIDEGYFDLTAARKSPLEIAETIRRAIRDALKITVSEGLGSSKLVSQIASKLHKPASFFHVPTGQEIPFLHPLPNIWLPGIGPKTAQRLNAAGLAKIGQIAATPTELLALLLGRGAPQLRDFANGIDPRPVVPERAPAKSYSQQETFAEDLTNEEYLEAVLRRMADHLMATVRADHKSIRTLTVKVRYNDLAEDQCGESLSEPTDLETDVYSRLRPLLRHAWKRRVSLRMVSLKFSNLYDGSFGDELPLETGSRQHEAQRRLAETIDQLRHTHGSNVVMRGHDFILKVQSPSRPNALRLPQFPIPNPPSAIRHPPSAIAPIPLAVHSFYSFLDSTLSIDAIIALAKRHELPAIALTDRGNLHGAVEFAQAAKAAGIKPIIGTEIQVNDHPLRLYVQNAEGYRHLCRILSSPGFSPMNLERGHSCPLGSYRTLGPTRMSALLPAPDSRSQAASKSRGALSAASFNGLLAVSTDPRLAPLFPGRFYLAITHPDDLRRHAQVSHLPMVACPPAHYATPADRWKYDVVQSIRTRTLLRQEHPDKQLAGEFHFQTPAECRKLFAAHPALLERSHEIADRCTFELPLGAPQFPAFTPPDGSPPSEFLRRLVLEGLRRRYPHPQISNLQSQVEEELAIIHQVGYEEYFLVVWDLLQECRQRGIEWLTRGSAADSLVCYCLGISSVCPIRFQLYFRRFLNQDRMLLHKLPDIDVDFPHDRKDDVVDLIFAKYGTEHTAIVGGFSTYQARSAVGDVAKVLGVSEFQIRRLTERLPQVRPEALAEAIALRQECRDLPLNEEPYRTALQMAVFLDGFPRHAKMHPCGVVISRPPMAELTPCFVANKGYPTTHFDMDAVEAIGLVKIDILAQGGLAAMRDVAASVRQRGLEIDRQQLTIHPVAAAASLRETSGAGYQTSRIADGPPPSKSPISNLKSQTPPDADSWIDPRVWDLIAGGGARAVHHIESPAMIGLSRRCQVRDIDGLIAIVSVIRPGAANENKKSDFVKRYQGLQPITYPHPSLEPCLKSTFGLVAYEEHILQICETFAGLSGGRADVLRRALGKKKDAVIADIEKEFKTSARARGHDEAAIERVWQLVAGFKGYAFCKAHSTAYGVEAYQSAWLKCYFPVDFMAAVLGNGKGFYAPLVYVLECHRLGIPLLPPWINEPGPGFTVIATPPDLETSNLKLETAQEPSEGPPGFGLRQSSGALERSPPHSKRQRAAAVQDAIAWTPAPPGFRAGEQVRMAQETFQPGLEPSSIGSLAIRVPVTQLKGLTDRTRGRLLSERARGEFRSLPDFYRRVAPLAEEMEALIRVGAFDGFGQPRTAQFWDFQFLRRAFSDDAHPDQGWLLPSPGADKLPSVPLREPTRRERLEWEADLLGFPASGHPLELYDHIAWDTYCPVARLGQYIGEQVVTCGLVIEQRIHHQVTGEPMKFLTLADWTGMVETELFAPTYKSYGLATVRYPVLEITATVEPYENGKGYSLRVHHAGKPREKKG